MDLIQTLGCIVCEDSDLKNISLATVLLLFNLYSTTFGIIFKFLGKCQTKNSDAETLLSLDLNIRSSGNEAVVSKGTSPKGVSHTCLCLSTMAG